MNERRSAATSLALVLLVHCGSPSGAADEAAPFLGDWVYGSGAATVTCTGQPEMTFPLAGGKVSLARGMGADLQGTDPTGCMLQYDVRGDVATLTPGQSCAPPAQGGTQAFSSGTLTLSADGMTLAAADVGTFTPTGTAAACPATLSGTLARSRP
jgi:hypothetical protein